MPTQERSPKSSSGYLAVIVLVIVTLLALGRLCLCDFTWWDDQGTVHHNPHLNPLTFQGLLYHWTHAAYGLYIPVTYTFWAMLCPIARTAPDGYGITLNSWLFHAANLAVHLGSVLITYRILRVLNATVFASTCGALLFAIHPIQVEAVGWISGAKDVLSGMLALAATLQYVRFARADLEGESRPWRFVIATVLFVAAMLAKPGVMALPLITLALDRWVIERSWRKILPLTVSWTSLAIPIAVLAMYVQDASNTPMVALWAKPLIAADSLAFYLYKLAVPIHLCVEYSHNPTNVLIHGWCYWDWIFPAFIAILLIAGRKKRPVLLAAGLAFAAGCLPTLGWARALFQVFSTTTDHYLYLSMFGPALAIAWVISNYDATWIKYAVIALLVAYVPLSIRQSTTWQDDITIFEHCTQVNPLSYVGWVNLGGAYQRVQRIEDAIHAFRNAVAANPDYPLSHSDLAEVLFMVGDDSHGISEKMESIRLQRLDPNQRPAWGDDQEKLGQVLLRYNRREEAIEYLKEAAAIAPDNTEYQAQLSKALATTMPSTTQAGTTQASATQASTTQASH